MAMKIGSKYKFFEVFSRHWDAFAKETGLTPAPVKKRILEMAQRLTVLAQATQASLEAQGQGHPILGAIVGLIAQRCALTTNVECRRCHRRKVNKMIGTIIQVRTCTSAVYR
jgi:serine/threonine-protein kinase HipA